MNSSIDQIASHIPNINADLNISDYTEPIKLHCDLKKFWHIWLSPTDKKITLIKIGKLINQITEDEESSQILEKIHYSEKIAIDFIKSQITNKRLKGYDFYLANPKKRKIDSEPKQKFYEEKKTEVSLPKGDSKSALYDESHYKFTGEYLEAPINGKDFNFFQIERNQNYLKITKGKTSNPHKESTYHQYLNEDEAKANANKFMAEKIANGYTRNKVKFQLTFSQIDLLNFKDSVAKQIQAQTNPSHSNSSNQQSNKPPQKNNNIPNINVNNHDLTQKSLAALPVDKSRNSNLLQLPVANANKNQRKKKADNYSKTSKMSDLSDLSDDMRSRNSSSVSRSSRSHSPSTEPILDKDDPLFSNININTTPSALGKPVSSPHDVLLAETWDEGVDPKGYYMSEKLDGVRCLWTGNRIYSRNGNQFYCPEWFTKGWPNASLDGELWIARNTFQQCIRVIKKKQPEENEWKKITYLVFDAPSLNLPFIDRYKIMEQEIKKINNPHIKLVENRLCLSKKDMETELEKILGLSGEGVMLRDPQSYYERKRSHALLKVKKMLDDEALVIGYIRRPQGDIKAMQVQLANGKQFKLGGGLTDQERRNPPKIGIKVTFKYQNLSEDGIPRFPIYLRPYDKL